MKTSARISALLVLGSVLAGCAALPGGGPAPVDAFDLTPPPVSTDGRRAARTQILVTEPTAIKMLDGQDIVVKTSGGAIQYLGGVRWADRLPRIVQTSMADLYQRSGRFGGVGMPGEGLAIDYQILADLRSFDVQVNGAKRAEVELFVRVLNDRNGVVRASRTFRASAPVTGTGSEAFAAALDRAFSAAVADLVDWTVTSI
ncbi:membrane integrity-associated transporter subunit PqiC [Nitratireductor aquimarinus]|uniref:ABC-type transport auxiliary lipoprotein family protein n=1 Tax=Nitratireductor aquimarinus TaxID=889300 RepID=A0ABU4ARG3_9HYPH|nr:MULTISPECIES: ABC-type transport auxiliary lipoprotein family protein [Nitratireductor]MBN8244614.1 membrane integrity-associated transporter subunit PqiC [Nitratireductor aquimarinus]MBY6133001.1 membrane integrity-associated transporter subunit PqiC [Nitratireductor aquimarinus]MCA1301843.1 ABC-type transport auxiliary lipoprotein family protein [Nitratireductor aquimarinus]MCV0350312.1 ABC-type transport auxiliary lipoprotein family protein [Nitratireductor sp.]MDV6228815.1 ABC-type tran